MDPELRQRMLRYYDERASEYDQAYTQGTGTASIRDPEVFKTEARQLADIVARNVRGRTLDLACGTAYWLPYYGLNCPTITLLDQSDRMLAEARAKASRAGILDRCLFRQGDFLGQPFERAYDSVLVGFLLSHLSDTEEPSLFDALRTMLVSGGRFLILESAWTPERAAVNAKVERQLRRLNDGTLFEIYKRYCDLDDVERWAREYGVRLRVEYFGAAFLAVSGAFDEPDQNRLETS
jgi:SAM-dependent methyltransferase